MSNYDVIYEKKIVELSDVAMEAVAGGREYANVTVEAEPVTQVGVATAVGVAVGSNNAVSAAADAFNFNESLAFINQEIPKTHKSR